MWNGVTRHNEVITALKTLDPISVNNYLAGELVSAMKHEYVGGVVYAMAGGTNAHVEVVSSSTRRIDARVALATWWGRLQIG